MKAVVLAAGKGTRLRPLTYTRPKALLTLANKPIIQYILEELQEVGVDEIFVVTNYLEEKIKSFFSSLVTNIKVNFVHQESLGGTGDALKSVVGKIGEDFLMVNGDEVFSRGAFKAVLETFKKESAMGVVGVCESEHPERYGVVLTDSVGAVNNIVEKPKDPQSNLVNAGVYAFSPKIFGYLEKIEKTERGEYELTDAVKLMAVDSCRVYACKIPGWQGVSTLWDLFEANKMKIEERIKEEGAENSIIIGENVKILPGVYMEGSVIIGDGSVIGPNCYIRGHTSIGKNCRVGNGTEIKNSIIMDNSNVPHLSYVGDSVIGENCNMAAGTITANLRHDKKNVKVLIKGEVLDSGHHKIGAFIGDWTKTGIGTMIYPGILMGPFSWTEPNITVNCNLEPFTILGSSGKKKIYKENIETAVKKEEDKEFLRKLYEELKDVKY